MIYLVDNTIDGQGESPRELRAVLGRLVAGLEILTEPFKAVSLDRIRHLRPSHIVLSGQSHPWDQYPADSLTSVFDVIRNATEPILGVCGGHQQIALAYGAQVDLMERIGPGEGYDGARRERGFFEVETDGTGLFENLPRKIVVWHSHCDEVKELPADFRLTASNPTCSIQAMQHKSRPVFGVQFHPELFSAEHPLGQQIIENFMAISANA